MTRSPHEIVLDLTPPVTTDDGALYRATVIASAAEGGGLEAWLEFVSVGTQDVLRTSIETHQRGEQALRHWAAMLSDVYLRGAIGRASRSAQETAAHRAALAGSAIARSGSVARFDPVALFALGEHVLRRELALLSGPRLRALIINHDLNATGVNLTRFTRAQLVAFMTAALEARAGGTPQRHKRAV